MNRSESESHARSRAMEWLRHAHSDLRMAQLGQAHDDILKGQVCFHAQQATEKALKALFLSRSLPFPLTHDLEELLELAEQGGIQFPSQLQEIGSLTPYAVETRYPGDWSEISNEEVKDAIDLATYMIDWVIGQLGLVQGEIEEILGGKRPSSEN